MVHIKRSHSSRTSGYCTLLTLAGMILMAALGIVSLIQSNEGPGMSMTSSLQKYASGLSSSTTSSSMAAILTSSTPPLPLSPKQDERVAKEVVVSAAAASKSSSSSSSWADNDPWKPVDCDKLLYDFARNLTEHQDPNKNQLYRRLTKTKDTPFWISLHNPEFDKIRFAVFEEGWYYEKVLTAAFQEILAQASPNARVLDVGGNVGWFTLLSASLGHHVDVFEANILNVLRLCQSATLLNHWLTATEASIGVRTVKQSSINIHNLGVSDKVSTMDLFFPSNPGAGSFLQDGRQKGCNKMSSIEMRPLDQMAMDLGWLDNNNTNKPKFAIMKIDVEGFEPNVVAGATKFLASGLVENILMEMSGSKETTSTVQMIRTIVDAGFVLYKTGRFSGPNNPPPKELPLPTSPDYAQAIIMHITPRPIDQANLWWKLKVTMAS